MAITVAWGMALPNPIALPTNVSIDKSLVFRSLQSSIVTKTTAEFDFWPPANMPKPTISMASLTPGCCCNHVPTLRATFSVSV